MQLGRYDIIKELGRGGFGVVYRAMDTGLQVERALKVLHPALIVDPEMAARFTREAQVAAMLEHPNILPVYDIGDAQGRIYLAMKYMAGGSLKDRLAVEGKLPFSQALDILGQVAEGLAFAHQQGIIHRDLKPGNILFDDQGDVRISDFGFAKVLRETGGTTLTMSGGILGTPAYMAPELWNGTPPPSSATDVYALACVFYEMITGEVLFNGDTPMAVMAKHAQGPQFEEVAWPLEVTGEMQDVIHRALEQNPGERLNSAMAFYQGLMRVEGAHSEGAEVSATASKERMNDSGNQKGFSKSQGNESQEELQSHPRILEKIFGFGWFPIDNADHLFLDKKSASELLEVKDPANTDEKFKDKKRTEVGKKQKNQPILNSNKSIWRFGRREIQFSLIFLVFNILFSFASSYRLVVGLNVFGVTLGVFPSFLIVLISGVISGPIVGSLVAIIGELVRGLGWTGYGFSSNYLDWIIYTWFINVPVISLGFFSGFLSKKLKKINFFKRYVFLGLFVIGHGLIVYFLAYIFDDFDEFLIIPVSLIFQGILFLPIILKAYEFLLEKAPPKIKGWLKG